MKALQFIWVSALAWAVSCGGGEEDLDQKAGGAEPSNGAEDARHDSWFTEMLAAGGRPVVLPSPVNSTERTLFVLVTEEGVTAERYLPLARRLQNTSPRALWVGILEQSAGNTNVRGLRDQYEHVKRRAETLGLSGLTDEEVILAAHFSGASGALDLSRTYDVRGIVLLAPALPEAWLDGSSGEVPVSVLTVAGELDGRVRLTRVARVLASLTPDASGALPSDRLAPDPVVVVPQVNHAQFLDGAEVDGDLAPEVSLSVAQERIASVVNDFVLRQFAGEAESEAGRRLEAEATRSSETLAGILTARADERGAWCERMQLELVRGIDLGGRVEVDHGSYDNLLSFSWAKPKLEQDASGLLSVTTAAFPAWGPVSEEGLEGGSEATSSLSCKMKSREAIAAELGLDPGAETVSCADLNRAALQWALDHVSPEARRRFETDGTPLVFLEDRELGTGIGWLPANLTFGPDSSSASRFVVQSPSLVTSLTAWGDFAGNHYCKLMSSARAMEWVLVESLRR